MKTAVFLNTFGKMNNYDMTQHRAKDVRLVAVTSAEDFPKFQQTYAQYFDAIHASPAANGGIDFEFACQIVQAERAARAEVRIICQSEDYLLLAAQIRESCAIPGLGYEKTLHFRDKVLMKQKLAAAGVRTPKFFDLAAEDLRPGLFGELARDLGLPFIVKPRAELGGSGVFTISSPKEFEKIAHEIKGAPERSYQVEEFLSGTLFHCDSIQKDGLILFETCCEYSYPNLDFQKGRAIVSIPLASDSELAKRIFAVNRQVLRALGYENGVAHHELFVTQSGEIVFLEIGARSPGALITPMYRRAFGIAFEDVAFDIEMSVPFELPASAERFYMSGILPVTEGRVLETTEPKMTSSFQMDWLVKKGDMLPACLSLRDKAATITVWASSREQLRRDFDYLKNFQCLATA